ncbi:hypothetical protein Acr_25g0008800 [Actinidia rufa]|uniref:Transposase (putative) gypsy type domain-containing protein n=1 Tax=Actinidia rufa TaxID=165716 RepID=A0A7J0H0B6_9ERIC|nr:hypothetical protein Acr_25g0008800 [Actinidia rufa]
MLLCFLGTGPRMLGGRLAQTNRSKGPGRGHLKPLRRGDQTKVITADEIAPKRITEILVERLIKPSILPHPRARRSRYPGSWRADEHSDGGSSELNGDDSARSHGLVLPQSRGFGDKQLLKRSRASSSAMVLRRRACLCGEFYPTSVAPLLGMLRRIEGFTSKFRCHLQIATRVSTHEHVDQSIDCRKGRREWTGTISMIPLVRLPNEGEIITSTRPGEVAFYEAAFPAGLRFPIHPTIRLILQFYNICPAQLVPNAWRTIACSMALWRVYRYSISLTEFRNLFSLNSNPKPDQGWLYFKARNKKKFCSEDTPATLRGGRASSFLSPAMNGRFLREHLGRAPQKFRGRGGFPDKHCNNPPRLYGDETKVFEEIFRSIEESGRFSVPVLLESKSFCRVFVSPGSRALRTAGDNLPSGEVPSSSSDVGEFQNPHEQARRESPSRDDLIECLGFFRTELRRLLPHIPDLTLLRWTGGKVLDPILDHYLNVPSSNPSSESCSDSSLPVELESDAMSKRVSFKKIGEKLGKAASSSSRALVPAKGVVIGEKRAGESIASSPSKKGKADDGSKGKGVDIGPEGKKKATSFGKAPTPPATASPRPGEGSSANLGAALGPTASMLGSPSVAEKLLAGGDSPSRQGESGEAHLGPDGDETLPCDRPGTFRGAFQLEAEEQMSLQEGRAASMETEIARLQKVAADLERQLAESRAREQQANDELAKAKSDRDLLSDKFERSGMLVNELREALNKSKEFVVEEFKSSSEFMVAVEDSASKYFGEGFNFCKVQLHRYHPYLAIDLEGTVVNQDLLAEQDEAEEENDKEKTGEDEGCCFSHYGDRELGDENL